MTVNFMPHSGKLKQVFNLISKLPTSFFETYGQNPNPKLETVKDTQ